MDATRPLDVKESKCDFIFGVWFGEQILERGPVLDGDFAGSAAVGDLEEDCIL